MNKLNGRVSIITGAARGLGSAIARKLTGEGCITIINDLDQESLSGTLIDLKKINNKSLMYAADITNKKSVYNMFEYAFKKTGKIDILVNNAGITRDGFLHKMKDKDW